MDPYDRFELILNDQIVKTPIAIASMAGYVDAHYALERAPYIGAAFLGGYSIDDGTIKASHIMAQEGRKEFLSDDPIAELRNQVALMKESDVVCGLNLRGSTPESYQAVAENLGRQVIYEIDAHCRQPAMMDAGCGEYFLTHPHRLTETVEALKSTGVVVSVKIRAGVSGDDRELSRMLWRAGADIIHVDLMDFGHAKLRQIRNTNPLILIANNSINTFQRAKDMFSRGADLISLARRSDIKTLRGLDAAIKEYADDSGWYNAPKQLCRGGDVRALTFCCMPVKDCPLLPLLDRIKLSRADFVVTKQEGVRNTPLEEGENTCFGSMAYCCKSSTPCMFRDISLFQQGISKKDYMRYKHRLCEKIMARVFHEVPSDDAG